MSDVKAFYQTIQDHEVQIEQEIQLSATSSMPFDGGYRYCLEAVNEADSALPLFGIIKQAACNAVNIKNVFGPTISKAEMELLSKTRVTVDGRTLVPQFAILRNGDELSFARFSLKH